MAFSAEEIANFEAQEAQQAPAAGGFTAAEIAKFEESEAANPQRKQSSTRAPYRALPKTQKEYSGDQLLRHAGQEAARGGRNTGEFLLDVATAPFSGMEREQRARQAYSEADGFWEGVKGYGKEMLDIFEPTLTGEMTNEAVNPTGELPRIIPEGESDLADAIGTGSRVLAEFGTGGFMGPAGKGKSLLQQATPLLKSAAGGTAGAVVGEQVGGDTGELIGLLTGATIHDKQSAADALKLLKGILIDAPGSVLKKTRLGRGAAELADTADIAFRKGGDLDLADPKNLERAVRRLVLNRTGGKPGANMEESIKNLVEELRPLMGDVGTTGQKLDDRGLQYLEREGQHSTSAKPDPKVRQRQLDQQKRDAALRQQVVDAGDELGASNSAVEIADAGVVPGRSIAAADEAARLDATAAARRGGEEEAAALIDQAKTPLAKTTAAREAAAQQQAAAEAAQRGVSDTVTSAASPVEASGGFSKTLGKSQNAAKKVMDEAYAKIPGGSAVPVKNVTEARDAFLKTLGNENKQNAFRESFPATMKRIDNLVETADIDDISDVLKILSGEAYALQQSRQGGSALKQIPGFQKALYKALETGAEGATEARKEAVAIASQYFDDFGPTSDIGKALDKGDAAVGARLVDTASDEGVAALDRTLALGGKEAKTEASNYMLSLFNDSSSSPAAFKAKYARQLDQLPEAKKVVDAAIDAESGVTATSKALRASEADEAAAAKDLAQADTAAGKMPDAAVAKVKVPTDKAAPERLISAVGKDEAKVLAQAHKIMDSSSTSTRSRVKDMTDLVKSVGTDKVALARLQKTFARDLMNVVDKDGKLIKNGLEKFNKNRSIYEDSGLYTAKQLDNMAANLNEGKKVHMLKDVDALAKLDPQVSRLATTAARMIGATTGAVLMPANKLIGSSIGSRYGLGWLNRMTKDKIDDLVYELSVNPDKLEDIVNKAFKNPKDPQPGEFNKMLRSIFDRLGYGAAVAAADEQGSPR